MSWTKQQADAHQAKMLPRPEIIGEAFSGKEEELAQLCIAEIKRRRWYFTRNTPGRYSTSTAGTTDLIIAAPNGVTHWIELKKKSGKLSEAQNITRHVLLALGHRWACVYSYADFLRAVNSLAEDSQEQAQPIEPPVPE